MRLVERQYTFLDLANWVVPIGLILIARQLHISSWLVFVGLMLGFICVNYKPALSEGAPTGHREKPRPLYSRPVFWLGLALAAYLGYLLLQSQWFLWTLIVGGTIGALVATFLRWRFSQEA